MFDIPENTKATNMLIDEYTQPPVAGKLMWFIVACCISDSLTVGYIPPACRFSPFGQGRLLSISQTNKLLRKFAREALNKLHLGMVTRSSPKFKKNSGICTRCRPKTSSREGDITSCIGGHNFIGYYPGDPLGWSGSLDRKKDHPPKRKWWISGWNHPTSPNITGQL